MATPTHGADNVPSEIGEREDTGVIMQDERLPADTKIAVLLERYNNLKANAVTRELLHHEVTGARKSIEASAVSQYADAKLFTELQKTVAGLKPKEREIPWLAIAGLVIAIAGPVLLLTWNAAHYPERAEFTEVQRQVNRLDTADKLNEERKKNLDDALREIRKDIERMDSAPKKAKQ